MCPHPQSKPYAAALYLRHGESNPFEVLRREVLETPIAAGRYQYYGHTVGLKFVQPRTMRSWLRVPSNQGCMTPNSGGGVRSQQPLREPTAWLPVATTSGPAARGEQPTPGDLNRNSHVEVSYPDSIAGISIFGSRYNRHFRHTDPVSLDRVWPPLYNQPIKVGSCAELLRRRVAVP